MNDNSVLINGSDCQKVVLIPNQICSVPTGTILPTGNEGDIYQIVGGSVQAIPLPGSQFVVNPDGSATHTSADGTATTLPAPPDGGNSTLETQIDGTILLSTDDGNSYTLDPNCACVTIDAATGEVVVTPADGSPAVSFDPAANSSGIATNSADIATNTGDIATNTAGVATNTADIATNTAGVATNTADIATNTAGVATNTTDIATNTAGVATNATDIATNTAGVATNATDIATNTAGIATNATDIATNTAGIATNATDIATNTAGIATNAGDIATNATDIATNTAGVATNTAGIATNAGDIATNATDIAALQADSHPAASVGPDAAASGSGSVSIDPATQVITYTPQVVFDTPDANGKVLNAQGDVNITGVIDPTKMILSDQGGPSSFDPVAAGQFEIEFQGQDLDFLSDTVSNVLHLEHDTGHVEIGSNVDTGAQLYVLADDTSNLLKLQRDGGSTLDVNNVANGRVSITATDSAGAFQDLTLQPDQGHVSVGTPLPNPVAALTTEANAANNYNRGIHSTVKSDGRTIAGGTAAITADVNGVLSGSFANTVNAEFSHEGGQLASLYTIVANTFLSGSTTTNTAFGIFSNAVLDASTSANIVGNGRFQLSDAGASVSGQIRNIWAELSSAGNVTPQNAFNLYVAGGPNSDEARNYLKHWTGINTPAPTDTLSVNGTASKTGGGSWAVFSDERIKTNVSDYANALEKIEALRIVEFDYSDEYLQHLEAMSNPEPIDIDEVDPEDVETAEDADDVTLDAKERQTRKERREAKRARRKERRERRIAQKKAQEAYKSELRGKKQVSVIAQEAQKVFPNAVEVKADLFKDQLSFDSNEMIYANVAATKELAALVRSQAAVIEKLTNKVEALENGRSKKA